MFAVVLPVIVEMETTAMSINREGGNSLWCVSSPLGYQAAVLKERDRSLTSKDVKAIEEKHIFCRPFDPVQSIHGDIWSTSKRPRYLVWSQTLMLRKCSWVQRLYNIYFYFWFTGFLHKNNIMFYWSNYYMLAVLPVMTPLPR